MQPTSTRRNTWKDWSSGNPASETGPQQLLPASATRPLNSPPGPLPRIFSVHPANFHEPRAHKPNMKRGRARNSHNNGISTTTAFPQQRDSASQRLSRKRRESSLCADLAIKISSPDIALLYPSYFPPSFPFAGMTLWRVYSTLARQLSGYTFLRKCRNCLACFLRDQLRIVMSGAGA